MLNKKKKYLLFCLWLWQWIYIPGFVIYTIGLTMMMRSSSRADGADDFMMYSLAVVFVLHFATILSILAQVAFYIWHVLKKNPSLEQNAKIMWSLLIFMFNGIVIPMYWWQYIRTAPENQAELDAWKDHSDVEQALS